MRSSRYIAKRNGDRTEPCLLRVRLENAYSRLEIWIFWVFNSEMLKCISETTVNIKLSYSVFGFSFIPYFSFLSRALD